MSLASKNIKLLRGHTDVVMSLDYFEDQIVSASKDKSIRLWRRSKIDKSQFEVHSVYIGHAEAVTYVCLAGKKGRFFASCSTDKNIKIWDVAKGVNEVA
jgi:guanine nucleotide-binding protein subunit beta-2-like 1 protein